MSHCFKKAACKIIPIIYRWRGSVCSGLSKHDCNFPNLHRFFFMQQKNTEKNPGLSVDFFGRFGWDSNGTAGESD
jgi:hypothetical protein